MAEVWEDDRITAFGMLLEAHAALMTTVSRGLDTTHGVPVHWFEVMLRLARSPEQRLRMGELANQVGLSTSGLTRLIDRMEEAGYVLREACKLDRRGAEAALTGKGQDFLRDALPAHVERVQKALGDPLGDELCTLTRLLRTVRDANGPGRCPSEL